MSEGNLMYGSTVLVLFTVGRWRQLFTGMLALYNIILQGPMY